MEDFLGSSRVITTATGTVCYDADFYPYGGERAYANTCPQNYKFEGKERDTETNIDDFGARYYSSSLGRWLSADWSVIPTPVPYANLTNPQTLNLYAMVRDNPETFADLDGHEDKLKNPEATDPNAADLQKPQNTQPAPTNPDGTPKPPANDVPKLPDGKGPDGKLTPNEWVPGKGNEGDRPTRWDPKYPIPGQSPPNVSWDPEQGHWDHHDGHGDTTRWLPGGGGQVDHDNNPITGSPMGRVMNWAGDHKGALITGGVLIGVGAAIIFTGGAAAPALAFVF